MSYDSNGLELTTSLADTLNTYLYTAVDQKNRRFDAIAIPGFPAHANRFNMIDIASYKDPRDAAFIAQEFAKEFSKEEIRTMIIDGTFRETAKQFAATTEIPEWQFPAEGLDFDDILSDYKYDRNWHETARDALVEVFKNIPGKRPALKEVNRLIKMVEEYKAKHSCPYRTAARAVVIG